jgi:hypothetical protein
MAYSVSELAHFSLLVYDERNLIFLPDWIDRNIKRFLVEKGLLKGMTTASRNGGIYDTG